MNGKGARYQNFSIKKEGVRDLQGGSSGHFANLLANDDYMLVLSANSTLTPPPLNKTFETPKLSLFVSLLP